MTMHVKQNHLNVTEAFTQTHVLEHCFHAAEGEHIVAAVLMVGTCSSTLPPMGCSHVTSDCRCVIYLLQR